MLALPGPLTDLSIGCVLRVEHGGYDLLCRGGPVRVTLGGRMLARIARDPQARPRPGDWCLLRTWPDGPRTLERVLTARTAAGRSAVPPGVLPGSPVDGLR